MCKTWVIKLHLIDHFCDMNTLPRPSFWQNSKWNSKTYCLDSDEVISFYFLAAAQWRYSTNLGWVNTSNWSNNRWRRWFFNPIIGWCCFSWWNVKLFLFLFLLFFFCVCKFSWWNIMNIKNLFIVTAKSGEFISIQRMELCWN